MSSHQRATTALWGCVSISCVAAPAQPSPDVIHRVEESDGGQSDECSEHYQCFHPPVGWRGPLTFLEINPAELVTQCPEDYFHAVGLGWIIPDEQDDLLECECLCSNPAVVCETSIDTYQYPDCTGAEPTYQLSKGCLQLQPEVRSVRASAPALRSVECVVADTVFKVGLEPLNQANICEVDTSADACEETGVCTRPPDTPYENICVWKDGESTPACPDAFPVRHFVSERKDDGRRCGDCECAYPDTAPSPQCDLDILAYADANKCTNAPKGIATHDTCYNVSAGDSKGLRLESQTVAPSELKACEPSLSEPSGEIVADESGWIRTICCQ